MRTILDSISSLAGPDHDVFCHFVQQGGTRAITHGELRAEAARFAGYFQDTGVDKGEVVLIILRHSPDLFPAFLGAMLAGAIPSFMPYPTAKQDPRLYWSSHQKLFARLAPGTLLTYAEHLEPLRTHIPDLPLRVCTVEETARCNAEYVPGEPVAPPDVALLQHSSGTTGLKKGVMLTHAAVLAQVTSYRRALQLTSTDRIVSWLPLYHDMGLVACFLLPLITRTPVVMLDPFEWVANPALLFDAIKTHRGTLCWLPNFAFHHLCRTVRPTSRFDLSSVRAWVDCSEPCRAETFALFADTFGGVGVRRENLQVCYAMAETVFAVTQTAPNRPPRVLHLDGEMMRKQGRVKLVSPKEPHVTALSTGSPISGLSIRIVDESGRSVTDGCLGEIAISGEFLFSGYYRLPEESQRKLHDGWYHTGDLGFLQVGELYVTGRLNDLIIVHGRNYYAHELEFLVNQIRGVHPGRNVAAGWFRPEIGSEEVVIISESDVADPAEQTALAHTIKQALLTQAGLTVFDVHLVPPGWLVKTTSGKLSRVENLNKYLAATTAQAASA